MKFPSKVTPYQNSIFPKAIAILKLVDKEPIKVLYLYRKSKMESTEFIETLSFLYSIKKIQLNKQGELEKC